MPTFEAVKSSYRALWTGMVISPPKIPAADQAARRIMAGKPRYLALEQKTGVPWFFIGLVHLRESNLNFDTYLGNGQSIHRVTTIVPVGRGPFSTFEAGAIDALQKMKFTAIRDWSLERIAFCLEGFNGYGYRSHGVNSPYLWAGTNRYTRGKYVRDGVFDPNAVDQQLGSMAVLSRLCLADQGVNERVNGTAAAPPVGHAGAPAPLPMPAAVPTTKQDAKEAGWLGGSLAAVGTGWYAFWGSTSVRVAAVVVACALFAALYWFVVRPVLHRYWALDDFDAGIVAKVRLALKGVKTKLFSWLLGIAGVALPVLSMVNDVDLSAFLPDIGGVPASVYQYGILALIGLATNALRNATTTPVGQTDLALAEPPSAPVEMAPDLPQAEKIVKTVRPRRIAPPAKAKRKPRKAARKKAA